MCFLPPIGFTRQALSTGPNQLLDLDFTTPTSWKDGFANFQSSYATDEWTFQSHTAGTYSNTATGGTATMINQNGRTDRIALGIANGGADLYSHNCWEAKHNSTTIQCSDSTIGDGDGEICIRIVFRVDPVNAANGDGLVSKRDNSGTYDGWALTISTSGTVYVTMDNGGTNTSTVVSVDVIDGAWHYATWYWNPTTNDSRLKVDGVEVLNTLTGFGAFSSTNNLALANGRNGHTSSSGVSQYAYFGICEGGDALNMYNEDFWNHGKHSLLTATTRSSAIGVPVSATQEVMYGEDQIPYGFDSDFTHTSKLAAWGNKDTTNEIAYSEDFSSGWSAGLMTKTARNMTSPDEMYNAYTLTAGATNDDTIISFTASDSTEYTFSLWVKRNAGTDQTFRLQLYDLTNTTVMLLSADLTATDTWQLFSITGTCGTGSPTVSCYIRIPTSGDSIAVAKAQCNEGSERMRYVYTNGVAATLTLPTYDLVGTAGEFMKVEQGEWEYTFKENGPPDLDIGYIGQHQATSGNANRQYHRVYNGDLRMYCWDSAGVYEDDINIATVNLSSQERVATFRWHAGNGLTGSKTFWMDVDGTNVDAASGPYTATTEVITTHHFMQNRCNVALARAQCWDQPRG